MVVDGLGADSVATSRALPEAVDGPGSDDKGGLQDSPEVVVDGWGKRSPPAICREPFVHPMCVIRPVFIMVTECGLSL